MVGHYGIVYTQGYPMLVLRGSVIDEGGIE